MFRPWSVASKNHPPLNIEIESYLTVKMRSNIALPCGNKTSWARKNISKDAFSTGSSSYAAYFISVEVSHDKDFFYTF